MNTRRCFLHLDIKYIKDQADRTQPLQKIRFRRTGLPGPQLFCLPDQLLPVDRRNRRLQRIDRFIDRDLHAEARRMGADLQDLLIRIRALPEIPVTMIQFKVGCRRDDLLDILRGQCMSFAVDPKRPLLGPREIEDREARDHLDAPHILLHADLRVGRVPPVEPGFS